VPKLEAGRIGFVRQHALPAEQKLVGQIAQQPVQDECRQSQQRRPVQGARQLPRKGRVCHRLRRGRIHGAGELGIDHDMRDQPDEIIALDPRHPLRAAADRSAEAELEWHQQVGEHAAVGAEHEADAQAHHAGPLPLRFSRSPLPGLAQAMAEATLAAVELGQRLVSP